MREEEAEPLVGCVLQNTAGTFAIHNGGQAHTPEPSLKTSSELLLMIAQNAGTVAGTQKVKWERLQLSMGLGYLSEFQTNLHYTAGAVSEQCKNENKKTTQSLKFCKGHG